MADAFASHATPLTGPADSAAEVTPGASALAFVTRGIYVGGTGDLTVTMLGGGDVTFVDIAAGVTHPIRATHILGSSTATDIVALW
jgi:hypothetical protein